MSTRAPIAASLALISAAALALRLVFVGSQGFLTDVNTFQAWASTLASRPLSQFYQSTSFADYPPGYFYILWLVGHVSTWVAPHGNPQLLTWLVKAPAIIMDLLDGGVMYVFVRRLAGERWAIAATALFLLNPSVIFISAAWGQLDSISGGLAFFAVYLLLCAHGSPAKGESALAVAAWITLACSLLVKPQAAILIALFLAFAFCSKARMRGRITATAIGVIAALSTALLVTFPFHPSPNPLQLIMWLYHQYSVGKDVYPYNSVNAFNLWTVLHPFWQTDAQTIGPFPQYVWGMLLLSVSAALIVWRYAQQRTEAAFVQACGLLCLAFFILSTRMHERYMYDGLLLTIAAVPLAGRYALGSVIFSTTLFANLVYSLRYLTVVTHNVPGVNQADMWGALDHLLSLVNVATFFWLSYSYLGQWSPEVPVAPLAYDSMLRRARLKMRSWFDPSEGACGLAWPLDYLVSLGLASASFFILFVRYWFPPEKMFDEVYFARAAEEYLHRRYIYENTHPPVTKLLITLSTLMFGDNSNGWRFLDVVFGAAAVWLLYLLLKRVTAFTLFASYGAVLFMFDGMHYVQSRIATPESFVVFFALATLYTFYRYWLAAQVRCENVLRERQVWSRIVATVGSALAAVAVVALRFPHESFPARLIAALYVFAGFYLVYRLLLERHTAKTIRRVSYPDGSMFLSSEDNSTVLMPDGGVITKGTMRHGDRSAVGKGCINLWENDLHITYRNDGRLTYATPAGQITYSPNAPPSNPGFWLLLFSISIALLVASKWYGVMAFGVAFTVVVSVWAQPRLAALLHRYAAQPRSPAHWGNPHGFSLDVALATVAFVTGTIYFASYAPQFIGLSDTPGAAPRAYTLTDVVNMQSGAFSYHAHLVATHPYQSRWWQWPLDLRPILYYSNYGGNGKTSTAAMIYTLPNPVILWLGLATVPLIGYLGIRERNKGYVLIVLTYAAQWLPWMGSPRISLAYHFYVNIPLICACTAIAMQRLWIAWREGQRRRLALLAVGGYFAAAALAFVYFYPILSGMTIPYAAWTQRMWLHSWI